MRPVSTESTVVGEETGPVAANTKFRFYRWYVLALLGIVYAIHVADRTAINLVLQPIKLEFHLSDGALGLLTGLGYALPFAIAGLPLGALADRMSRKWLLVALITLWSVFAALGGLATGLVTLLVTRMAVGAAESGSPPTALALISDYFPARIRASAVSMFYVGAPLGGIAAAQIAAPMAAAYGWRAALVSVAVPGVIVAVLMALTLREPARGGVEIVPATTADRSAPVPSFRDLLRLMARQKGIILLLAALTLAAMSTVGISTWAPSLLMRTYGMSVRQAGSFLALTGLIGIGGTLLGGVLAYWYARGRTVRLLVLSGVANLAQVPILLIGLLATRGSGFPPIFLVWTVLQTIYYGAGFGLVLSWAPPRMRGRLMALTFVLANVLGAGLGPQIIGLLSDSFVGSGDHRALSHAIAVLLLAAGLSGALFLVTMKFIPSSLRRPTADGQPADDGQEIVPIRPPSQKIT